MLWDNDKIEERLNQLFYKVTGFGYSTVKSLMMAMRDEYEAKMEAFNENGNAQQEAMLRFQQIRIAELEQQLAGWCDQCGLTAEHCRENHGQLYSEGCTQ